jgi:DNA invertase Pin-like site-specific DNA recombinase
MTRAAIYRRVSTQRQAQDDRFSLDDQLERCKQWCEDKGYYAPGTEHAPLLLSAGGPVCQ